MNYSELIAKLITLSEMLDEYEGGNFKWSEEAATAREAADALKALERVPMTEQQAAFLYGKACEAWVLAGNDNPFLCYCRAIEAHHGITPPESI